MVVNPIMQDAKLRDSLAVGGHLMGGREVEEGGREKGEEGGKRRGKIQKR